MKYLNCSKTKKSFYGIEFKPGEIKDVPGYISNNHFVRIFEANTGVVQKENSKDVNEKPASIKHNTAHRGKTKFPIDKQCEEIAKDILNTASSDANND